MLQPSADLSNQHIFCTQGVLSKRYMVATFRSNVLHLKLPQYNADDNMETQNHADLLPETYTAKVSESVTTIEVASSPASDSLAVGEVESSDTPNSIQSVQKNASVKINGNHASQSHVTLSDGHDVRTAIEVLQLIETYGSQYRGVGGQWHGLTSYVSVVSEQIKANEPVRLLFSGLDIKTSLALGKMPDLGEKLALAHLNGLCSNISAIYKTGAEVHICLRGFLFNGL
jgi:hypothetical protein